MELFLNESLDHTLRKKLKIEWVFYDWKVDLSGVASHFQVEWETTSIFLYTVYDLSVLLNSTCGDLRQLRVCVAVTAQLTKAAAWCVTAQRVSNSLNFALIFLHLFFLLWPWDIQTVIQREQPQIFTVELEMSALG